MKLPQTEHSEPEDKPQYFMRTNRIIFVCIGLFVILQHITIVGFFLLRVTGIDSFAIQLLVGWTALSLLAVCWIILKCTQGSGTANIMKERMSTPGKPAGYFSLYSLCSMMQEGLVLVRGENILYANSAFSYLLGVQENELIDTNIRSYIHTEDAALLELGETNRSAKNAEQATAPAQSPEQVHEAASLNPPRRCSLRMATSLGDYVWVICSVHTILWDGATAYLLLFENMAPLKQAQRLLEQHEQQSRIFVERTPLAVAMFDALGQITIANSAWYSAWSNVSGSIPKRFNILQDSLLPRQDLEHAIQQAFAKIDSGVAALEHATPWGETCWFNVNFYPMLTQAGNLIGVIMLQQDITDSIRSTRREQELSAQLSSIREEALANQRRYTGIFDTHSAVIVCIDENEKICIWNKAAEAHFGLRRQDALGREITQIGQKMSAYLRVLSNLTINPSSIATGTQKYDTSEGTVLETITAFRTSDKNSLTMLRIEKNKAATGGAPE
jgi:PAS domain S-box-containing protein